MNDIRDLDKILKIKVIGVGGAGNNAISRMIEDNVRGVSFYMINTETGTLKRSRTSNILQIGVQTTRGLGAGANEIVGERAAITFLIVALFSNSKPVQDLPNNSVSICILIGTPKS